MRSASASAELPLRGGGGQHDGGAQRPAAAPEAPEHGGKGEDGDAGGLPMGLVIEGSATLALAIREPVIAPVIAALFGINQPLGVDEGEQQRAEAGGRPTGSAGAPGGRPMSQVAGR